MVHRRAIVYAAPLLVLAGCAGFGGRNAIRIDEADLQRIVEREFPLDRRLLEVVDVRMSAPQLRLLAARNRIAVTLRLGAGDRVFGTRWQGRLAFDAALRFEPADQTLRLAQVEVTDFGVEGGAERTPVERLGAVIAERVLEDFTVYRLPPERQQQLRMAALVPGPVTVDAGGVEITLVSRSR